MLPISNYSRFIPPHIYLPLKLHRLIPFSIIHSTRVIIRSYCSYIPPDGLLNFFDHLLQQCATAQQCRQVHTQFTVFNSNRSAFLTARIVSTYSRFGLVTDSQNVFNTTPFECLSNLLLWNSILRANVSHGEYSSALKLYVKMRELRVLPDGFTFPLVLRASGFLSSFGLCRTVHNHVLQMGFHDNLHVVNELLGVYVKLGHMSDARKLFDKMSVRSYISWNMMISGFSRNHDCDKAYQMFNRMESEGFEPNSVTWTSLLSSYSRCGRFKEVFELFGIMWTRRIKVSAEGLAVLLSVCTDSDNEFRRGQVIHGYIVKGGFEEYLFVKNALICLYGKHRDLNSAESLFSGMLNKNIVSWNALITSYIEAGLCDKALVLFSTLPEKPNLISWSAVISGCASVGRGEDALQLFRQMQKANVTANSVTFSTVLSVCAESAALVLGKEVHGNVIRASMDDNVLVGNALINMYTKCGSLEEGYTVFENLDDKKDIISWNTMITGYGMHGQGETALTVFHRMMKSGFRPDDITFIAVLSACTHAGLVDKGRELFNMMGKEFLIEPQMEHYACMADLFGRAGLLQEASDIVKSMPMEPNVCVWGSVLNSCRMHKNTVVAEETGLRIFGFVDSEMSGSYMLLSNIYAASGRWEESARVRNSARKNGLRKIPGRSWIEVKKKVYMFSAGNNALHIGLEKIYGVIEELSLQMENEMTEFEYGAHFVS